MPPPPRLYTAQVPSLASWKPRTALSGVVAVVPLSFCAGWLPSARATYSSGTSERSCPARYTTRVPSGVNALSSTGPPCWPVGNESGALIFVSCAAYGKSTLESKHNDPKSSMGTSEPRRYTRCPFLPSPPESGRGGDHARRARLLESGPPGPSVEQRDEVAPSARRHGRAGAVARGLPGGGSLR